MYRLGETIEPPKKGPGTAIAVVLGIALLACLAVLIVPRFLKPNTQISKSAGTVRKVTLPKTKTQTVDGGTFTLGLPTDWQRGPEIEGNYQVYRWQKITSQVGQIIDVYVDTIPPNFGLNRVITVRSEGDRILASTGVSDNCAEFTKDISPSERLAAKARWEGADFFCDLANPERNVVGITTKQQLNAVSLQGASSGSHRYFIVYTENSMSPNYDPFLTALQTFRAK